MLGFSVIWSAWGFLVMSLYKPAKNNILDFIFKYKSKISSACVAWPERKGLQFHSEILVGGSDVQFQFTSHCSYMQWYGQLHFYSTCLSIHPSIHPSVHPLTAAFLECSPGMYVFEGK